MDPFTRDRRRRRQEDVLESFFAEKCIVTQGAEAPGDTVLVRLPNSESPRLQIEVEWRVSVDIDGGGNLVPRFPQEDDEGIIIYDDERQEWLIW